MKITVYTIKDCTFSKQEREYLNTNKLVFEEKDLETNKDFLTEMLAISNNFAGTPVTRVEKDDGTISVLKGFTKDEFDTTFGFTPTPAVSDPSNPMPTDQAATSPVNDTPIQPKIDSTVPPVVDVPPVAETPAEVVSPVIPPTPTETPVETPTVDQDLSKEVAGPLQSVMDSLKSKSQAPEPTVSEPPTMSPPVVEEPTVPPVVTDPAAPSIPDFPAK